VTYWNIKIKINIINNINNNNININNNNINNNNINIINNNINIIINIINITNHNYNKNIFFLSAITDI